MRSTGSYKRYRSIRQRIDMNLSNFAIVILNWNGRKLLEQFLPQVIAHSGNAAVYVIDNASTDDSVNWLRRQYPEVKCIRNSQNQGYAGGYNQGLRFVEESVYCLLNSDVEVTENWLHPIAHLFENPDIAIIQPKIKDYKNRDYFEYAGAAGGYIDQLGYPYCRGRIFETIEKDIGQYNDTVPIFWASGACFFIRKQVFLDLKGFDEALFAHQEEIDLCWRAFNHNYEIRYTGASTVYHLGGATLETQNPKKTYLNFRNSLFIFIKNVPGRKLWLLLFVRMVLDGIAGIRFLVQGKPSHTLAVLKAHIHFYGQAHTYLRKRKKSHQRSDYYKTKSIVYKYFIKRKRKFSY